MFKEKEIHNDNVEDQWIKLVNEDVKELILPHSSKFVKFEKCPSCGSSTTKEFNELTKKYDAVRRCTNDGFECEKMAIERIKHFVSKEALNIEGFGKKIVENFKS